MKVLYISAEVTPFAKVGGLADVAGSLPKALVKKGHDVRVVLPAYQMILDDPRWNVETIIESFDVRMNHDWTQSAWLGKIEYLGVTYYLIGTDEWYKHSHDSETIYYPGGVQHAFFSAAIFRAMELLRWIPDVLHANDWHTGFVPLLLRERAGDDWSRTASTFTIHNLAYQGEFGIEALDWLSLPHWLFNYNQVEAYGRVNFLKTGCSYADQVNTVSPTYAEQIQTGEYGCALDGLMRHLAWQNQLEGILNGIDLDFFNPETDPHLAAQFSAQDLSGKAKCRSELVARLGLEPQPLAPIFGMVTRLSSQKGLDLVLNMAPKLFELGAQLVVQGLGEPLLTEGFRRLASAHPKHFAFINAFDADLAQNVYAGCDGFLMPSSFEPCGLGQMIAMRYGTLPVVRATGGLKDTVHEGVNGFVHTARHADALLEACSRAIQTFADSARWTSMQHVAMRTDFGWESSAQNYLAMYEKALTRRRGKVMA